MNHLNFNLQNIAAGQGIEIAIVGMGVVFIVLSLISFFIALLPRILTLIARKFPEREYRVAPSAENRDQDITLAAIAYAMHLRLRGKP